MATKPSPTDAKRERDKAVHEAEMQRLGAEIAYARTQVDAAVLSESDEDAMYAALRKSALRHNKDTLKALQAAAEAAVVEPPAEESESLDEPEVHTADDQSVVDYDRQVDMFDARTA